MIRFPCSECGKMINAADEHAGKKAKCPGCATILVIPQRSVVPKTAPAPRPRPDEDDEPQPEPKVTRKPAPAAARSRPPVEEEEDVPEVEEAEEVEEVPEDDYEEDDRPRKKKKKRRREGEWATCPSCGCRGDAFRVYYSFWWGFLPAFVCHVQCKDCGTQYNGKTGGYNTVTFILIQVVVVVIGLGLAVVGGVLEAMSK